MLLRFIVATGYFSIAIFQSVARCICSSLYEACALVIRLVSKGKILSLATRIATWRCDECRANQSSRVAVSPITGELIPVDQMAEHMRISLIDPKFQQQREAMMSKIRETTKAGDDEIGRNLIGLARKRPDVFGQSQA